MRLKLFLRWNILDSINALCRITLLNEQHFKQTTDFSSRGIKSTPLIAREGGLPPINIIRVSIGAGSTVTCSSTGEGLHLAVWSLGAESVPLSWVQFGIGGMELSERPLAMIRPGWRSR